MMRFWRSGVVCCAAGLWFAAGVQAQSLVDQVRGALAGRLERQRPPSALTSRAGRNASLLWSLTRQFYARRDGRPAWIGAGSAGTPLRDLLQALQRAEAQGLDSADYSIGAVEALRDGSTIDPDSLAALDIVASAAFLRFGTDLAQGRVAPGAVDTMWAAAPRSIELIEQLVAALDASRVGDVLAQLAPPQAGAENLRAALTRYRGIAARGGWSPVPAGPPLVLGAAGPRIEALRRRLEATGDLSAVAGTVFDAAVLDAVERAQARFGLDVDGVAGPATLRALNVPIAERIQQLELNLERWRWMPRELGDRYIAVNSAAFTLALVDSGCTVFVASVIAGRVDWPTPITSGTLTDVAFNPRWNIPRSIAVREVLPLVRRDPGYFAREGIHVMSDATENAAELDPASIPWESIQDSTFVYRFWQEPGPRNPLGRIRFSVSNRFGVALHDTPNPERFRLRTRVFSHGCVRVAGAEALAAHVLRAVPGWGANSEDSTEAVVSQGIERHVGIPQPIPVYLSYWTAWMDESGTLQFRPDVYGWDAELAAALRSSAPRRVAPNTSSLRASPCARAAMSVPCDSGGWRGPASARRSERDGSTGVWPLPRPESTQPGSPRRTAAHPEAGG
jgi:L,D-transpeptidase YcbB